jgi:hypothetical protein
MPASDPRPGSTVQPHAQTASWNGTDAARSCQLVTVAPILQDTGGCHGSSGQDGRGGATHTGRLRHPGGSDAGAGCR